MKEKKKQVTHSFLIKKKNFTGPILLWGLSMLGGLRPWPKWPRPRAGPAHYLQRHPEFLSPLRS